MTESKRVARLELPKKPVRMVLDTDTFNEVDDQFALAYAVRATEMGDLRLEAVYAAPYSHPGMMNPGDGMEASYKEIHHILDLLDYPEDRARFVFRGADRYTHGATVDRPEMWQDFASGKIQPAEGTPVDCPAVRDLIDRAMTSPDDDPLYVVGIGACTNIASAIMMKPEITEHIVVLWLGGNADSWPDCFEFNIRQDIPASRVLLDSGVPLVQFPAHYSVGQLITSIPELEYHLKGKSRIGTYLCNIVSSYSKHDGEDDDKAWSKVIWDIAPISYLINPIPFFTTLQPSPFLESTLRFSHDRRRHLIRIVDYVDRNTTFTDCFRKLKYKP